MAAQKRKCDALEPAQKRNKLEEGDLKDLLDLPLGPLHMLMNRVDFNNQRLLRISSEPLKQEHTGLMIHDFNMNLHKLMKDANESEASLHSYYVLQVQADATNFFINSGYDSMFSESLLRFNIERTPIGEDPNVEQMHKFLYFFYNSVEQSKYPTSVTARMQLHRLRLIQTMTLLNLFRKFRFFRIVSSSSTYMHWHLQIEIAGMYLFMHNCNNLFDRDEETFIDFLTIISELLVFDMSTKNVKRLTEIGNNVYAYGIRNQTTPRGPRLSLVFTVLAPLEVRGLLEDALYGKVDGTSPIDCPLTNTFSVELEVKSKRISFWAGSNTMDISILPLS